MDLKKVVTVWGNGLRDEYGAIYSTDEKELVRGPEYSVKKHVVREGTEKLHYCAFKDNPGWNNHAKSVSLNH